MKKQIFSTLVLSIGILLPFSLHSQEQRKKVGVVLSGGGAKGMAHIKALKVIEEAGIPIDYIAGTSMGAIVGGLYAIGYTTEQLDSMVRKQDWTFLLSDRIKRSAMSLTDRERSEKYTVSIPFTKTPKDAATGGLMKGQNLANLFSDLTVGYHDSIDFNKLPIPFACVAANVVNGEQIVFHDGILSTAMRASMAIPGVFTPVRQDSMVLVDGGIVNNYPADVVKAMGADIIIGVDVQNALKKADKLNSVPDILGQIVDITCQSNHEKNVDLTDTYIRVNVEGYSSASFTPAAIDTLMRRGEEAAKEQWNSLLALKKKIGIAEDYTPKQHGPYSSLSNARTVYVTGIQLSANDMVRPGDWITLPSGAANGTVQEITLNTVKIQNFDNTISTVPPYTLVSSPFQNWRGMVQSGGRRVMKNITLDLTTLQFCTPEMLDRYRKEIPLMADYQPEEGVVPTNSQVYRVYIERYLCSLPVVNQDLDLIISQKEATMYGVPIQVYFFSRNKVWKEYERIQSDIFDHFFAMIPKFELKVYQYSE